MAFQFKMQKILHYRKQLEEEAKVRLAHSQSLLLREQQRMKEIQVQLEEQKHKLYHDLTLDIGTRWLLENFVKGLTTDMAETSKRIRQFHEAVTKDREVLLVRAKEHKMLEKLKEKQRERYYAAQHELERKINDETATLRHGLTAF